MSTQNVLKNAIPKTSKKAESFKLLLPMATVF